MLPGLVPRYIGLDLPVDSKPVHSTYISSPYQIYQLRAAVYGNDHDFNASLSFTEGLYSYYVLRECHLPVLKLSKAALLPDYCFYALR